MSDHRDVLWSIPNRGLWLTWWNAIDEGLDAAQLWVKPGTTGEGQPNEGKNPAEFDPYYLTWAWQMAGIRSVMCMRIRADMLEWLRDAACPRWTELAAVDPFEPDEYDYTDPDNPVLIAIKGDVFRDAHAAGHSGKIREVWPKDHFGEERPLRFINFAGHNKPIFIEP